MSISIEHVAIWVNDLEVMRRFYQQYFQAKSNEKYVNPAHQFSSYFLTFSSGARLGLMEMPGIPLSKNNPHKQFTGLIHLAISLGSEAKVDSLTEELRYDGFEILDGPRKTGDGYYESTVLDPENNRLELTV